MKINLGKNSFDLDTLVNSRLLIQANSGGGKSWVIRRLLEQSHGHVQQIVIDLEGEFSTLREKYDYILAGKDGDVQADPKTAALLARKLLELNVSAIIDLYELHHYERRLFVKNFLTAMVNAPKELWHECLVIVDEAHVFCPEKGQSEASEAVIDLATRGRKRGFAAVLATQRLSKLHKDAAAECNNKLIGRTGLDVDMKRAAEELGFTSKEQYLSLRALEPGEFFAFGPAISKEVIKTTIGPVTTTHPSVGSRIAKRKPSPPPAKIKAVLKKLTDLPTEAQQEVNTIADLKNQIRELRLKVRGPVAQKEKELNSAVIQHWQGVVRERDKTIAGLTKERDRLAKIVHAVSAAVKEKPIVKVFVDKRGADFPSKIGDPVRAGFSGTVHSVPIERTRNVNTEGVEIKPIGAGERKILAAIAQQDEGMTREHITVVTGYKRSSRDTYLQRLFQRGFITIRGNNISATDAGIQELGDDYEQLPTGSALQEHVLNRLPLGEKKILGILIGAYPDAVRRDDITEQTGYQRSSRDTYLQRLSSRQLVVVSPGAVVASDKLFD